MEYIGKYKIIKELGAGGFGAVYLCEDPLLKVQVAIKVFKVKDENMAGQATSASTDAAGVLKQRFVAEAQTLHKLGANPYIVNIKAYDEMDDGTPYYIMPYLPNSLENEIGKDAFSKGKLEETPKHLHPRRLATNRALEVLKQILEGLAAVHQAGLVHRDIKPANILFDEAHNVQLCDFGIAKTPDAEFSQSGVAMGSRNYMSPEQRESAKHVAPQSDVYSVGVVAYRMFTGTLPSGRFKDPIEYAPEIGEVLNNLILSAIEQHETERPKDGHDFLVQFKRALNDVEESTVDESDHTGTEVGDSAATQVKAELKPLKAKITELLSEYGEITEKDIELLMALAFLADLDKKRLLQLIEHTKEEAIQINMELAAFINWVSKLNQKLATGERFSEQEQQLIIDAGIQTTGKEKEFLATLIESKLKTTGTSSENDARQVRIESGSADGGKNTIEEEIASESSNQHLASDDNVKVEQSTNRAIKKAFYVFTVILALAISVGVYQEMEGRERAKQARADYLEKKLQLDVDAWNKAERNDSRFSYKHYLKNYPDGKYVEEAKKRIILHTPIPLTIKVTPTNAKIEILNIKPTYSDGIKLKPGNYQVRLSKKGYLTKTEWITIKVDEGYSNHRLSLEKDKTSETALEKKATTYVNIAKQFDRQDWYLTRVDGNAIEERNPIFLLLAEGLGLNKANTYVKSSQSVKGKHNKHLFIETSDIEKLFELFKKVENFSIVRSYLKNITSLGYDTPPLHKLYVALIAIEKHPAKFEALKKAYKNRMAINKKFNQTGEHKKYSLANYVCPNESYWYSNGDVAVGELFWARRAFDGSLEELAKAITYVVEKYYGYDQSLLRKYAENCKIPKK